MIKIGFAGAHGTGKTSMAKAMLDNERFKRFDVVPSTARQIKKYGYPINREANELSQTLVPVLRIIDEHEAFVKNCSRMNGLISDRTVVDSLAYTSYQYNRVWDEGSFIYETMKRLTTMHMETYNVVLYFPVYWQVESDGIRDDDAEYQRDIDEIMAAILVDYDYHVVPNVSPEERAEWFIKTFPWIY